MLNLRYIIKISQTELARTLADYLVFGDRLENLAR